MLDKTGERVLFVVCTAGSFIGCVDNVKSEEITKGEKITQDGKMCQKFDKVTKFFMDAVGRYILSLCSVH